MTGGAVRIRLSGRALAPLGLLMLAVVLGIGGAGWSAHSSDIPARSDVSVGSAVLDPGVAQPPAPAVRAAAAVEHSISAATASGGMEAGLLPHHLRLLAGTVLLTALPSGAQPYWVAVLGLGLYLWGTAGRNRLRPLCRGSRHATRAPPVRS